MVGIWGISFPGLTFKLVIKLGQFTLNGRKFVFLPSTHVRFPVQLDWFTFTFQSLTYYIRITNTGINVFRFNKNRKIVTGTGKKVTGIIYLHNLPASEDKSRFGFQT